MCLSLFMVSKSQKDWDKIDLLLNGKSTMLINFSTCMVVKNDSECYVRSGLYDGVNFLNEFFNLEEINLNTGVITLLDTFSNRINYLFYNKQKLFGVGGYGLWQFNFTSNKWDSINDFWVANYHNIQKFSINLSQGEVLLFGKKIEKFNTNNNTRRVVCDSSIFSGGTKTNKNYYAFYQSQTSLNKNYDSVYLLVSTDKGEHWNVRRRFDGNFDDKPRFWFVNSDTGYISYVTKAGTPLSQRQCHVLRTNDGGLTWPDTIKYFQQTTGATGVREIHFLDKNIGFVSYGTSIFKTIDGGNVWYETQGVYTDGLKTFFINDSVGYSTVGKFFPAQQQYILKTSTQGGPPFKTIDHTGIQKTEADMLKIHIYPNPNKGDFTIGTPNLSITGVKVYDNNSKVVFVQTYNDQRHAQKIQLPQLAAGIYYVHVSTKEIPTIMTKMIVK